MTTDDRNLFSTGLGMEAAKIINAPIVKEWLATTESRLINEMIAAPVGEQGHSIREGLTAQIRAHRTLARSLENAVSAGERANKALSKGLNDGDGT
mgnify:CR=1 FL=1